MLRKCLFLPQIKHVKALKYLALLITLFVIGLGLLGFFNPSFEVENEVEIISGLAPTWDVYTEGDTRSKWYVLEGEGLLNQNNDDMKPGHEFTVIWDYGDTKVMIDSISVDSLVLSSATVSGIAKMKSSTTFWVENGFTHIKENQIWHGEGFLNNVKLNFDRSSLEKRIELRLKALKDMIEKKE